MLNRFILPKKAIKAISSSIGAIFDNAKKRFLGREAGKTGIRIVTAPVQHREDLSLKGIFTAAAKAEGMPPNEKLYDSLVHGVNEYLDAHEKLAIARTVNAVQSHLHDAESGAGPKDPHKNLKQVVEGILDKVSDDVKKVIDTESNRAKNYSTLDAISKIGSVLGIPDKEIVVFFAGPVDDKICKDCLRLFFLEDRITPRVWKVSELKNGYFKKGDQVPSVGGLHVNCRHALSSVLPGYGFRSGKLAYIEAGFDVYKEQRGA